MRATFTATVSHHVFVVVLFSRWSHSSSSKPVPVTALFFGCHKQNSQRNSTANELFRGGQCIKATGSLIQAFEIPRNFDQSLIHFCCIRSYRFLRNCSSSEVRSFRDVIKLAQNTCFLAARLCDVILEWPVVFVRCQCTSVKWCEMWQLTVPLLRISRNTTIAINNNCT